MWKLVKRTVQIVLMLLGLTGLVDNIVVWHGFLANIIAEYQSVRDFIFGFLPFDIPNWTKDYLVFGTGIAYAIKQGFEERDETGLLFNEPQTRRNFFRELFSWRKILFDVLAMVFWPITLLLVLVVSINSHLPYAAGDAKAELQLRAARELQQRTVKRFTHTLFLVAVFFLGALFVFSDALSKLTGS